MHTFNFKTLDQINQHKNDLLFKHIGQALEVVILGTGRYVIDNRDPLSVL